MLSMKPRHEASILGRDAMRVVEDESLIGCSDLTLGPELCDERTDLAVARRLLPGADGLLLILDRHLVGTIDVAADEQQYHKEQRE